MRWIFKLKVIQQDEINKIERNNKKNRKEKKRMRIVEQGFKVETIRAQIMNLFVQLNTEFRNTRIRHNLLICGVIFCRFAFSTFLDIVLLEHNQGVFLSFIKQNFNGFINASTSSSFIIFNISFLLAFISVQLGVLVYQLHKQTNKSKICISIGIIQYALDPLLTRYHIKLITSPSYAPQWICLKILCFISAALTLFFQFFFLFASTNPQTKNQNLLVRQRRFKMFLKDIIAYLLLITSSLIIEITSHIDSAGVTIIILHLLISIIQIDTICRSYLYHSQQAELVFCVVSCIQSTICFASFIASLTSQPLIIGNMELVIVALTLFLFQGCKEYRGFRNDKCILSDVKSMNSLGQLKLYIHLLAQSLLNISGDSTKLDFFLNSLKNQHHEKCNDAECICHRKSNTQQEKLEFQRFLARNQLKSIMQYGKCDFQLTIFCCYFNLVYFNAFPDLLYKLNEIPKKKQLNYFECLEYECFKGEIREYLDKKKKIMNAVQTQKLQQQDEIILFYVKAIQQICSFKYLFWFGLGKKIPDFKVIHKSASDQIKFINLVQKIQQRIYKSFLQSRAILQFVCLYEIFVKIKSKIPDKIKQSLRNFSFTTNEQLKVIKNRKFKIDSVMFERYCVLFQSQIHMDNMGIILNVTKNITRVFGYTKEAIVGQNISQIMPKSMQKQHDAILQSWRERASWANIHKTRFIFAMTRDNVCFQAVIYLRIVQRLESVNLLAAFVKANQNDYMIVNDDKIIDGVGLRFKNILGFKVAKLPFSIVCSQASEIFALAKKGQSNTTCGLFYHVKGLQDEIQAYQYLKFQLNGDQADQQFSLNKIKVKERSLIMTVEYKPYKMGSKFFMILKLIDHQKPNLSVIESNVNIIDLMARSDNNFSGQIKQYERQNENGSFIYSITSSTQLQKQKIILYQSNPSVHTSQHESNMSNEKIFSHLEQKFKKNAQFKCRSIRNNFIITLCFCFFGIGVILFDYVYSSQINRAVNQHSREAVRFIQRAVSLGCIYSRFQNVDNNISDIKYQIQRAEVEIRRVQSTILNMQTDLYQQSSTILHSHLSMDAKWVTNDGKIKIILFPQYYTYFLIWCKELQQRYIYQNESISMFRKKISAQNLQYIEQYIDTNFHELHNGVISFLGTSNSFSKTKIGVLALILLIISFMLWRSADFEEEQHQAVLKVLLSISERNCQQCGMYFRKITTILSASREQSTRKGNEAQYFEKQLIDRSKFEEPLKQLQLQKDKFEKNKSLKYLGYKRDYKKYIIILLPLVFVPFLIYDLVQEHLMIINQIQFIQNYYQFMDVQIQCVKLFISTKSNVLNQTDVVVSHSKFDSTNKGKLNNIFLNLIQSAKIIYPLTNSILQYTDHLTLCQSIQSSDQHFYNYNCLKSTPFPYYRLRIYEANSMIETSMFNLASEVQQNKVNISASIVDMEILEETMNLAYISLCAMEESFYQWLNQYTAYKMSCLKKFFIVLTIAFVMLLVMVWWFSMVIHKKMHKNCWRIIVIPQSVIRNTKGAMRHIADVIRILK